MTLKNAYLLWGLGLILIPILLHILMRNKPKKLPFPALRLIQVRRKTNIRRLRLRHLWLLLLRALVIGLLVFGLTRPTLPAANYGLNTPETVALLGILLLAGVAYFVVMSRWQRQRLPNHQLSYRRGLLRAGTFLATLLLLLLLVGWPYQRRLAAEVTAPAVENLPVAAVMIFDTSLSMDYRHLNETRLELAKKVAADHLNRLPRQSRVAVTDTAADNEIQFQAELLSAKSRIEELTIANSSFPLNSRIQAALRLHETDLGRVKQSQGELPEEDRTDQFVREIYLFTDLSATAWRTQAAQALREKLAEHPNVQLYILDLGVESPVNVSLQPLRLTGETVLKNSPLTVSTVVRSMGAEKVRRQVEFQLQTVTGELINKEKLTVDLEPGDEVPVSFTLPKVSDVITQGQVTISAGDPLGVDNTRFFTAQVLPPTKVLLVGEPPPRGDRTRDETFLWELALAPDELREANEARYEVTRIEPTRLPATDLSVYAVVCLINVLEPAQNDWLQLQKYVAGGGGLAVFLGQPRVPGRNNTARAYQAPEALDLLPFAELSAQLAFTPPETLTIVKEQHPVFAAFEQFGGVGELTAVDVRKYWKVVPHPAADVLVRYTGAGEHPALLERTVGSGRVTLLTTGVDLRYQFSDLPLARWSFVAFADHLMRYLSQRGEMQFNYVAGNSVLLKPDREKPFQKYLLRQPNLEQSLGTRPEQQEYLPIGQPPELGNYQVIDRDNKPPQQLGFSVNPPPEESDFTRLTAAELNELLGEHRYHLSRSIEELERVVTTDRIGQEVFPLILLLLIVFFCVEHFMANFFYETDTAPASA